MLTHMMIQYIVGLCYSTMEDIDVSITVGDMISDPTCDIERDIDITVTSKNRNKMLLKAIEVKDEKKPIDVVTVEQLCLKMTDIGADYKAIFSTSGYSESAKKKAKSHGVVLFSMEKWEQDFIFTKTGVVEDSLFNNSSGMLLFWNNCAFYLGMGDGVNQFTYSLDMPVFDSEGKRHSRFSTTHDFHEYFKTKSQNILYHGDTALYQLDRFLKSNPVPESSSSPWPYAHTLECVSQNAFINIENSLHQIYDITISGNLIWRCVETIRHAYVLRNVEDGSVFCGAAVMLLDDTSGRMYVFVLQKGLNGFDYHFAQIPDKQKNILRNLKIR